MHHNIPRVFDLLQQDQSYYVVTESLNTRDLAFLANMRKKASGANFSEEEVKRIAY